MDVLNDNPSLSDEETENDDGIQRLVEGLNLSDLSSAGTEFTVHVNEDSALEGQTAYEEASVLPHLNLSCLGPEDDEEADAQAETSHDGLTPFSYIAKKMTDLVPNGKVKKRILSEGYGEVVPEKAVVWFHHNSYVEGNDTPIDSSYLRGPMTMLRLNCGRCILGLDIGLSSMKRDEKAEFLIHPDYAYGNLGVPPRIPEKAYILIRVEMKKFVDNALAMKMGELTEEELKTVPFEEVHKGALSLLHNGKIEFVQKRYHTAIKLYRNGIRTLENCSMNSDEEDAKNEALRLKLYTNLGVCYNKLNRPKQAIVSLHNALRLEPKGVKILYQLGLAHLNLSSFDEAKKFAFLARKYEPHNTEISMLLQKIDKKLEIYNTSIGLFAKNAFKFEDKSIKSICSPKDNNMSSANESSDKYAENGFLDSINSINSYSGVSITEVATDNEKRDKFIEEEEAHREKTLPLDSSGNSEIETEFQLETISYIEEFYSDVTKRELPLPFGLTYEEEMFFKNQAMLYNLRWVERDEEGRMVVYLVK